MINHQRYVILSLELHLSSFLLNESIEIVIIIHNAPKNCIKLKLTFKKIIESIDADKGSIQVNTLAL